MEPVINAGDDDVIEVDEITAHRDDELTYRGEWGDSDGSISESDQEFESKEEDASLFPNSQTPKKRMEKMCNEFAHFSVSNIRAEKEISDATDGKDEVKSYEGAKEVNLVRQHLQLFLPKLDLSSAIVKYQLYQCIRNTTVIILRKKPNSLHWIIGLKQHGRSNNL